MLIFLLGMVCGWGISKIAATQYASKRTIKKSVYIPASQTRVESEKTVWWDNYTFKNRIICQKCGIRFGSVDNADECPECSENDK